MRLLFLQTRRDAPRLSELVNSGCMRASVLTQELTVGDLAYVSEPSNKGFKATVLGPYVVTHVGDHTVAMRTSSLVPGQPSVAFTRHFGHVARATTAVDVLETLLRGMGQHTSLPRTINADDLLKTHVHATSLPAAPPAVCNVGHDICPDPSAPRS